MAGSVANAAMSILVKRKVLDLVTLLGEEQEHDAGKEQSQKTQVLDGPAK